LVELFAADIRQIAPHASELFSRVEPERQARVRAFRASDDALRCLAAGLLLADAFGDDAQIVRDARGKPCVPGGRPFSLSHAGDYAVLALSSEAVGVDIERVRPVDWDRLSARFFHPGEHALLLESRDPLACFFRIWTLKESYLKAEGVGFSRSPAHFCILPESDGSARPAFESPYRFRSLDAFEGYCLSVCSREPEVAQSVVTSCFS